MNKTLLFVISLSLSCMIAKSATVSTVTAAGGAPGAEGWTTGDNGNPAQSGNFSGDSAANGDAVGGGAGNPAWGLYANSGATSDAFRNLNGGALTVGQTVSIDFDNGNIDTGATVGVSFQDSTSGQNGLEVYYVGGDAVNAYKVNNGTQTDSTVGFTDDGFTISLKLTASGQYEVSFNGFSSTGTLNNSLTSIDRIRVFNFNAGSGDANNVFFNNVVIIPESSTVLFLLSGGFAFFLKRRRTA